RQPERFHAFSHGRWRNRSLVLCPEFVHDRVCTKLVSAVLDEQRDLDAVTGPLWAEVRRRGRDGGVAVDHRALRWDEPNYRGRSRRRDAAEPRLSFLSTGRPPRAFVTLHGNVVDVNEGSGTAQVSADRASCGIRLLEMD